MGKIRQVKRTRVKSRKSKSKIRCASCGRNL